ncbi:hypothetical protein [Virgibacillus sp. Bac332]|uniref:hypothetical protein n=1 Tax=Virgibacillus sp. Bac332 TaxID=2419842 RepID=UPI000EF4EDE9|nr:hypothetical protein [Virgibacillus sp. Bac332]
MYEDIEQTAVFLMNAIKDIPKRYERNETMIKKAERETQDLLHTAELTNFNAFEGYTISKELKEVRTARRNLKDENDLLVQLNGIMKRMQPHVKELNEAIGAIKKEKRRHKQRSYKCRVRKDLQNKFLEVAK